LNERSVLFGDCYRRLCAQNPVLKAHLGTLGAWLFIAYLDLAGRPDDLTAVLVALVVIYTMASFVIGILGAGVF